jgi:hypothetical protein
VDLMTRTRTRLCKRKRLRRDIQSCLEKDRQALSEVEAMMDGFIGRCADLGVEPLSLLYMANLLQERARGIYYNECLESFKRDVGKPSLKELKVIQEHVDRTCGVVRMEGLKDLISRQERRQRAVATPVRPAGGNGGEGHPYVCSQERPYYVQ